MPSSKGMLVYVPLAVERCCWPRPLPTSAGQLDLINVEDERGGGRGGGRDRGRGREGVGEGGGSG